MEKSAFTFDVSFASGDFGPDANRKCNNWSLIGTTPDAAPCWNHLKAIFRWHEV